MDLCQNNFNKSWGVSKIYKIESIITTNKTPRRNNENQCQKKKKEEKINEDNKPRAKN